MQIVIDIPDRIYNIVQNKTLNIIDSEIVEGAIRNGTPLSKGHGRLKDIDAFITKVNTDRKHSAYLRSWTADDVLNSLDANYASTIIEADTESEEVD